jgi:hypothetical protein
MASSVVEMGEMIMIGVAEQRIEEHEWISKWKVPAGSSEWRTEERVCEKNIGREMSVVATMVTPRRFRRLGLRRPNAMRIVSPSFFRIVENFVSVVYKPESFL